MSLATCPSCVPMSLLGKVTPRLALPAKAAVTACATEMAPFNELCAACTKVTPLESPSRLCRAVDPGSVAGATSPKFVVVTLEGCVLSPTNCRALPASVMTGGTNPERAAILSDRRPDQPVVLPPCGVESCHATCWSECE